MKLAETLFWWPLLRWSPRRQLGDVTTILVAADPQNRELHFQRLAAALELIKAHHPPTHERIRKHFAAIVVFGMERYKAGHWDGARKLCFITEHYLTSADTTPDRLSLTLAHESMHARLDALGAEYPDGRRAPIEVMCAMAELALARRLPDGAPLIEATERRIGEWSAAGEAQWSRKTWVQHGLGHLRELGVPRWLIRALERF
jgi:hypothetical protein